MTDNNGQQADNDPPIRFGNLPNQIMPTSWAESILRDMFAHDPARFGRYLQAAVTGIEQTTRGRKPAQS